MAPLPRQRLQQHAHSRRPAAQQHTCAKCHPRTNTNTACAGRGYLPARRWPWRWPSPPGGRADDLRRVHDAVRADDALRRHCPLLRRLAATAAAGCWSCLHLRCCCCLPVAVVVIIVCTVNGACVVIVASAACSWSGKSVATWQQVVGCWSHRLHVLTHALSLLFACCRQCHHYAL